MTEIPITTIRTTCKVGACEPYCGIEVDVADDRMVEVRPDKAHPVSKGYLCVKGHHLLEYQNDPDRLLRPTHRIADRWEPTTWDEATTAIGQRLRTLVDGHGPTSVATYWGNAADSANIVLALTTAGAFGSNQAYNVLSLEFTDRGANAQRMFGDEGLMLQPDADHTTHALLLGTNPVVTQGMALLQRRPRIRTDLRDIQRRGGSVTVVDPRQTETTELADTHLAIRPGTDLFLLVAMIRRILDTDAVDHDACERHTTGLDAWEQLTRQLSTRQAADICGIDAGAIDAEADRFASSPAAFATTRVGVQTAPNTTLTEWAVTTLNAITGNIDRPGGMIFHPGAGNPADYLLPGLMRNNFAPSKRSGIAPIFGGLPATDLADNILSDDPERVRALIVLAGNPLITFPDTAKMEAALTRLDLLVCLDIYLSDTATFAHWALPAATQFEKGSWHFMVGKYEPTPRIEWRSQVIPPTGDARPEWHIMQDILVAADAPFLNNPELHQQVLDHRTRGEHYPEEAMYRAILPDGLTLEEVMAAPGGVAFPLPASGEFYEQHLATSDGRIHLAPHEFVAAIGPALATPVPLSPEYPFLLISGFRRLRSFNSWTHNMPSLTDRLDEPHAHLHPDTAATLGVADGESVRLTTEAGAITVPARVTDRIRTDTVAVPQFWGHTYPSGQHHARQRPGNNVNRLHTTTDVDLFTGMPVFNGRPCRIERADVG
jgi:formate dehydrogenase